MKLHFYGKQKFAGSSNDQAFTLIEVLIAFSVFSTITFFILPIFQIILDEKEMKIRLQAMEWDVFCSQIKKEIRMSSRAEVTSGRLILTKDNETVQFEKYGSNLRRQVNSTGHEIILQNVSQYSLSIQKNAVKISVIDIWGKEYSLTAYALINWSTDT